MSFVDPSETLLHSVTSMLDATPGQPLAASLSKAQMALMDDADTSHPFYWAAFIIMSDGDKPLLRR